MKQNKSVTKYDERERNALKKVINPFVKPYPYWHTTTIDRLKSILQEGLMSENYAKKIGKKNFKRNFDSTWNVDSISLVANESSREATCPEVAILISKKIKVKRPNKIYTKEDKNRPVPNEVLVRDKILPTEFLGLVIGEVGWSYKLEKAIKPRPVSIIKVVKIIESAKPEFLLPIYFKGKLVWPKLAV